MTDPRAGEQRAAQGARCARCGERFACGIDSPRCWCAELPALKTPPSGLGARCVCERCLREMLAREAGDAPC